MARIEVFFCGGTMTVKGFLKKSILFFTVLTITFILIGMLFAEDGLDLEKIVVISNRYGQEILTTPAGITVINQEEIKNSSAQSVIDLLKPVPGVSVRVWTGNPSKASADLRGFGEQGALDTLVLVDNRRVNEIDMSGTDWTQIPLNQVEKIEILRGGSGSVLYGDNAASGVINIITKKSQESKPRWDISTQAGSFDLNKHTISIGGLEKSISYWLQASRDYTNGYRKNSYYKSNDFAAKLAHDFDSQGEIRLSSGVHKAQFGFPGALSEANLVNLGRKATIYPKDHTNDNDYYIDLGGSRKINDESTLDLDVSYRKKEITNLFLSSYAGFNPIFRNKIQTIGLTPKYINDKSLFEHDNKLVSGFDFFRSDYSSNNCDDSDVLQNRTAINKISAGYYAQDEFKFNEELTFQGGLRYDQVRYDFDYHDNSGFNPDIDQSLKPDKTAYNSGLVYKYSQDSSFFIDVNRSFRYPATDEYFSVWATPPVNTQLKPQTSQNYEFGFKHSFNSNLKADLTFFRMDVLNELYYNPLTFTNTNYDKTRHDGIELCLDSRLNEKLKFSASYTLIGSKFRGGTYDNKYIPMVPKQKASVGLRFFAAKSVTFNLLGNYVDQRYFINDQANRFSRLKPYLTLDSGISYTVKDLTASLGLNNIFDEKYFEYGVCNSTTGAKNYYPAVGRNFSVKLEYKF
jgi:iron complex outermembrane recepter protein